MSSRILVIFTSHKDSHRGHNQLAGGMLLIQFPRSGSVDEVVFCHTKWSSRGGWTFDIGSSVSVTTFKRKLKTHLCYLWGSGLLWLITLVDIVIENTLVIDWLNDCWTNQQKEVHGSSQKVQIGFANYFIYISRMISNFLRNEFRIPDQFPKKGHR